MFDPSEASRSTLLMEASLRGESETIFRISGMLQDESRDFTIPIDSTVESVTISGFVQCKQNVSIARPSGQELSTGGTGLTDNAFKAGRIVTAKNPDRGNWQLRITGRGFFSVIALAKSDIALDTVRFVEPGGRPGHEGLFPINGEPGANQEQQLQIEMSGSPASAKFEMIGSNGQQLQAIQMDQTDHDEDSAEYLGKVTPVGEKFRIIVEGQDQKGYHYQRMYAPQFQPQ